MRAMQRSVYAPLALAALLLSPACSEASGDGSSGSGAGGGGDGGSNPGESCADRAAGSYVLALSTQLGNDKPLYFDASVTTSDGAIEIVLTPLVTPFRDDTGATAFAQVPPSISVGSFPVGDDGSFTAAFPSITVPAAANPITGSDIEGAVTLEGRACPDGAGGSFCGTVTGQVTKPIPLPLTSEKNFFAFNEEGASLAYKCVSSNPSTTSSGSSSTSSGSGCPDSALTPCADGSECCTGICERIVSSSTERYCTNYCSTDADCTEVIGYGGCNSQTGVCGP